MTGRCRDCRFFLDDPAELERELVGITILSSAYGDTRGDQGLCLVHQQLLTPGLTCERFEARGARAPVREGAPSGQGSAQGERGDSSIDRINLPVGR